MWRRYLQINKDDELRRQVCQIPGEAEYRDPMHPGRNARVRAISDGASERLMKIWLRAIPSRAQFVVGGNDRSEQILRTLPKGRVKSKRIYTAGSSLHPLRRKWRFTTRRVIYFSFIVKPDGSVEAYVGKAGSKGRTSSLYIGMDGRCGQYLALRRLGRLSSKRNPTPHEKALMDPENECFIRTGAVFDDDDVTSQQISLLEDLLSMYMRVFQDKGMQHGYLWPEQHKLVQFW